MIEAIIAAFNLAGGIGYDQAGMLYFLLSTGVFPCILGVPKS
jgi:hypothetical protein